MQGLWKNSVSGWNEKGFKRKKQNTKHFFNDKIDGLYKNSTDVRINSIKSKDTTQFTKRSIRVDIEKTRENYSCEIKYIQFKRQIRLSDKFIKRNCDNCEHNILFKEYFNEKLKTIILNDVNLSQEDKNIKIKNLERRKNWCKLDEKSWFVKRFDNYNSKTWFFDKESQNGCGKTSLLEFKNETKIFKVVSLNNNYYKILNKNKISKNRATVDSTWKFDKVIKETGNFLDMYSIDKKLVQEYDFGVITYKNIKIPYKYKKFLQGCYGYCCYERDFKDNKTVRNKNKVALYKLIKSDNKIEDFYSYKKSIPFYC